MLVLKFGGMLQPALVRTTHAVTGRLQPAMDRTAAVGQSAAPAVSFVLTTVSVAALVLGIWRLSADLGWAGEFFIGSGLLSHWQVWFALAGACKYLAVQLANAETGHGSHPR